MPLFSVVIPLFNQENYIRNTLKSVLNQSFNDYEIIIINDGSTDKSEEIVLGFSDSRIHYFSKTNEGVSAARNHGIKKANGTYIAFLDADDLWFPNHLCSLRILIEMYPEAGIYSSRYISKVSPTKYIKNNFLNIPENFSGIISDFFLSSLVNRVALTSAVVVPPSLFKNIGYFDHNITSGQDLDLWIKIALKYPVAITNSITVEYNAIAIDSISKINICDKKLIDFSQFKEDEKYNISLKAFIDVNRMDYAIKFKISGNTEKSQEYYKSISIKNITLKNYIIFHLPVWIQIPLLNFKKALYRRGFQFSVYR